MAKIPYRKRQRQGRLRDQPGEVMEERKEATMNQIPTTIPALHSDTAALNAAWETQTNRYFLIVAWARRRYSVKGSIVLSRGSIPSRYAVIEDLAAERYLGVPRHFPGVSL